MVRPLIVFLLTAAALLLSAGAAGAHTSLPAQSSPPAQSVATVRAAVTPPPNPTARASTDPRTGSSAAPAVAAAVAATALGALARSPRRLALVLVAVSTIVAADAAVHSVHHLSDPAGAASCALASGSMHAPAVLSATTVDTVAPGPAGEHHGDAAMPSLDRDARRPDRGRAPPTPSSAA